MQDKLNSLNELNDENFNELSDEEKRKLIIEKLNEDKNRFVKIKHVGKKTINNYETKFKRERKRRSILHCWFSRMFKIFTLINKNKKKWLYY